MKQPNNWNKTPEEAAECADYILAWIKRRNGAELESAFDNMRVIDHRLLREELIHILQQGGKPINWIV